jgi:hypothetical protein
MFNYSSFPFKKAGFLCGAMLGMCLFAEESFAQNEQEKMEPEVNRSVDRPLVEDQHGLELVIPKVIAPSNKSTSNPLPIPSTPIRREVVLNPEGKKVEPVPSTLSFNIFLYVVDKLKAD